MRSCEGGCRHASRSGLAPRTKIEAYEWEPKLPVGVWISALEPVGSDVDSAGSRLERRAARRWAAQSRPRLSGDARTRPAHEEAARSRASRRRDAAPRGALANSRHNCMAIRKKDGPHGQALPLQYQL